MMRADSVFRYGVSSILIAVIVFLGAIFYSALKEYDGTFVETIGFGMVTVSTGLAIAAMLVSLHQISKWKSV